MACTFPLIGRRLHAASSTRPSISFPFPPPRLPALLFLCPLPVVGLQRSLLNSLPRLREPLCAVNAGPAAAANTITLAVWIAPSQAARPGLKAPPLPPSPIVPSLYHLNYSFDKLLRSSSPRLSFQSAFEHSFSYRHSFNRQSFRSSPATSNTVQALQDTRTVFYIILQAQSSARGRSQTGLNNDLEDSTAPGSCTTVEAST